MALLFDLDKMSSEGSASLEKLKQIQMSEGGFPWFKGSGYPNRYITQHIASGLSHLQHLGLSRDKSANLLIHHAIQYLDTEILSDYRHILEQAKIIKEPAASQRNGNREDQAFMEKQHIGPLQIQYLYMDSFFPDRKKQKEVQEASDYFLRQSAQYWKGKSLYMKGMIALIQHRSGQKEVALDILNSLKENSISSEEMGMYWKENQTNWRWYQYPIETQSLMIEAFSEIKKPSTSAEKKGQMIDGLKVWLLRTKQTSQWPTTKATTEAVYSLLLNGKDWLKNAEMVEVSVGNHQIKPAEQEELKAEMGTGYFKTSWSGKEINTAMSQVKISTKENRVVWGALYWQYYEDLDKITHVETPLQLHKKVFLKKNTDKGEELFSIDKVPLKVGDLLRVRIELKVDRDMEFVHMKDLRASGLEPVNVLSEYKWQDGLGYYESIRDASTNFFFDRLPKGIYVFEYDVPLNIQGNFSNGITTVQCMYAPEFSSHSDGIRIRVEE